MTFLVGKFGWQLCKFDCHCKNGEDCDKVTGHVTGVTARIVWHWLSVW